MHFTLLRYLQCNLIISRNQNLKGNWQRSEVVWLVGLCQNVCQPNFSPEDWTETLSASSMSITAVSDTRFLATQRYASLGTYLLYVFSSSFWPRFKTTCSHTPSFCIHLFLHILSLLTLFLVAPPPNYTISLQEVLSQSFTISCLVFQTLRPVLPSTVRSQTPAFYYISMPRYI